MYPSEISVGLSTPPGAEPSWQFIVHAATICIIREVTPGAVTVFNVLVVVLSHGSLKEEYQGKNKDEMKVHFDVKV